MQNRDEAKLNVPGEKVGEGQILLCLTPGCPRSASKILTEAIKLQPLMSLRLNITRAVCAVTLGTLLSLIYTRRDAGNLGFSAGCILTGIYPMCRSSRFQVNSPEFRILVLLSHQSLLSRDSRHESTCCGLSLWPVLQLHLYGPQSP